MKYILYILTMSITFFIHVDAYAQCSGDNNFTGYTDSNWNIVSNWTAGCVPSSTIDGQITIQADCTIPDGTYTFNSGSRLQIDDGITLTLSSGVSFTYNGEITGTGTVTGSVILSSALLSPGDMPAPPFSCGDGLYVEGKTYNTAIVNGECWMTENLNVGSRINGSSQMQNNGIVEKYCYGDDPAACDTYGGLYQWNEMMGYTTTEGAQGICPDGWHIPTDNEWIAYEESLGMCSGFSLECSKSTGFRGTDEGSQLAGSAVLWDDGALDSNAAFGSSGFEALPGGYRHPDGSFQNENSYGMFWSSTRSSTLAWYRKLEYINAGSYRNRTNISNGFSVRCVKD